jgi:hypothetical protein
MVYLLRLIQKLDDFLFMLAVVKHAKKARAKQLSQSKRAAPHRLLFLQ